MPTRPAVMRRRSRLVVWFAVLATLALLIPIGVYAKKPTAPPPVTIQILNVSDWHGQLDAMGNPPNLGSAWSISSRWKEDRAAVSDADPHRG